MLALSEELSAQIRTRMQANGGAIPFSEFMELALYAPGLGYYSNGLRKFGADGDFITAPELTPLFGRCVARTVAAVMETIPGGDVLEFGAGSGALAITLLSELQQLQQLPHTYFILERSASLRQRQQESLAAALPELQSKVVWLDALPVDGFQGMMLGNEVLDASPVSRFVWQDGQCTEEWVEWSGQGFQPLLRPLSDEALIHTLTSMAADYNWSSPYLSELDVALAPWVRSVAECLQRGALLLMDYGSPRSERYHPQRDQGTLMCHYRHRAHGNPYILPGLQDITSYVDFTSVAEAGRDAGLQLEGFASQAHYLMDCGIDTLLQELEPDGSARFLQQVQQAKQLMMPGEMGERFKCMALRRGLDAGLPGFRGQDLRGRL